MEPATQTTDWQTWAAIAIVAVTLLVMGLRLILRSRNKARGCGKCGSGDCGKD